MFENACQKLLIGPEIYKILRILKHPKSKTSVIAQSESLQFRTTNYLMLSKNSKRQPMAGLKLVKVVVFPWPEKYHFCVYITRRATNQKHFLLRCVSIPPMKAWRGTHLVASWHSTHCREKNYWQMSTHYNIRVARYSFSRKKSFLTTTQYQSWPLNFTQ